MISRSWCFTLNNYTDDEIEKIKKYNSRYTIYGYETGKEGTKHLQGYIELSKPTRMSSIKDKISNRLHLETRRGTRDQARDYCKKEGNFHEIGSWESGGQGSRNDLRKIMKDIKDDKPMLEILEEYPETCAKNMRFIDKYKALTEKESTKEFRKVEVEIIIGDAGIGKTKYCWDKDPNLFTVEPNNAFPFDGYDGEKTILIDDFYGTLKYCTLLKILDGYQYRVNTKGSHRYAKWTKVFITSNAHPREWYHMGYTPALQRRTTNLLEMHDHKTQHTQPS